MNFSAAALVEMSYMDFSICICESDPLSSLLLISAPNYNILLLLF